LKLRIQNAAIATHRLNQQPSNHKEAKSMLCPACKVNLVMSDRQGIEIDYCPQCRGVWLDRGELDKIIERSSSQRGSDPGYAEPSAGGLATMARKILHDDDDDKYRQRQGYNEGYGYKKKKNWLKEIFD
jgi:uncharacterized protein